MLVEHVWARDLKRAVRDAGGRMLSESFLTPETVAAVEPELAAMSAAIEGKGARERFGLREERVVSTEPPYPSRADPTRCPGWAVGGVVLAAPC